MRKGERALVRIKAEYAWGKKEYKSVPRNADVEYDVYLKSFKVPQLHRWQIGNEERKKRAMHQYEEGKSLYEEGKVEEALRKFRDASDYSSPIAPDEDNAFVKSIRIPSCLNAAICCLQLDKWKEGLTHSNDALRCDREHPKALLLKAKCQRFLGQNEEAMETISAAVRHKPNNKQIRDEFTVIKQLVGPRNDSRRAVFSRVFQGEALYEDTSWDRVLSFFSEVANGVLFWTLFMSLGAQTWFFPLEYMDLTGYELIILFVLIPPFLLASKLGFRLSQTQSLNIVSVLLFGVVRRLKLLVWRVAVLGPATGLIVLTTTGRFSMSGKWLGFGAFFVMLDRFWGFSRSSFWTSGFWSFMLFACVAVGWFLRNPARQAEESNERFSWSVVLSLGSLLFLFQSFATQPSVIARWLDMPAFTTSIVVMLSTLAGLICPSFWHPVIERAFALLPLASAYVMLVTQSKWAVALFMFSFVRLWFPVASLAGERSLPLTMGMSILFWFVHFLGTVWTVAYNFVPVAGEWTREKTWLHLLIAAGLAGFASLVHGPQRPDRHIRTRHMFAFVFAALLLMTPIVWMRFREANEVKYRAKSAAKNGDGSVRGMVWAVHFGYDNFGRNSFEDIERIIRDANVNVVGLLESDLARPFNENWDLVDWLSHRLGMNADYGISTLNNTWGCALLSTYPIIQSHRILLPSPQGELACLIDATLDVRGTPVHVFVTHFGNYRDFLDRELQAKEVADMLRRAPSNSSHLYLGYLTNKPYSPHYNMLTSAGWIDSAPNEMNRWCQYIFYRGLELQKFFRIDTGDISDTEAQVAYLTVKKPSRK